MNVIAATVFLALGFGYGNSELTCVKFFGTNSDRLNTTEVTCTEEAGSGLYSVCYKMYGKDYGDRIQKDCGHVSREAYDAIVKAENERETDGDDHQECQVEKGNGRQYYVCRCTTNLCNVAGRPLALSSYAAIAAASVLVLLSVA